MNKAGTTQSQPAIEQIAPQVNLEQVQLAHQAAEGDKSARTVINELIHPIINYQTSRFCRRFCRENQYRYKCTLEMPFATHGKDALLCEWGNASYAWMLDDLTSSRRLLQFKGKHGARINDYLYHIANSLPFYERWKDWRFGRKVHVPTYIQALNADAGKVFLALRARDAIPNIAQRLGKSEQQMAALCQSIVATLTQRNRLHLLDPPSTVSLSVAEADQEGRSDSDRGEMDVPCYDEDPELREAKQKLQQVWDKLSPVEQYIMEAMLIEEQDATDVLYALKKLNISIKQGVAAENTSRQQLYYFRRKTLARLADLMAET